MFAIVQVVHVMIKDKVVNYFDQGWCTQLIFARDFKCKKFHLV